MLPAVLATSPWLSRSSSPSSVSSLKNDRQSLRRQERYSQSYDICSTSIDTSIDRQFWRQELPAASVEFVSQDFFQPQAIKDASVFLLFHILHNWGKTRAVEILRNLREAAGPYTKLIVGDMVRSIPSSLTVSGRKDERVNIQIIPHASSQQPAVASKIKGADRLLSPISPLLAPGRAEHGTTMDTLVGSFLLTDKEALTALVVDADRPQRRGAHARQVRRSIGSRWLVRRRGASYPGRI